MDNSSVKELEKMRHSAAHLLAYAVKRLYPQVKLAIGPATNDGFYYDFEFTEPLKQEALERIEREMKKLKKDNFPFEKSWLPIKEAKDLFKDEPYKLMLIDEINHGDRGDLEKKGMVSVYRSGEFVDLCKGPHVENSSQVGEFKLLSTAGAYWHGDEKNKMLTRIYGTSFPTKKELDHYLWQKEEAKKRDHRVLGKKLDLFVIDENIGKGLPLFTPKGEIIRKAILDYEYRLEKEYGFSHVACPHIARTKIYQKTGHWQHYRDAMYAPFSIDGDEYVVKPMNCPHHYMIYASRPRSYRDLPFRLAEAGTCYRYEKSGELSGLFRVRALTIDDAHILMSEDQIEEEFSRCIVMIDKVFQSFNLKDYYVRLSLPDPSDTLKYIADRDVWQKAGNKLRQIVKNNKLKYVEAKGEASFYGPKLDYMVKDSLGREWQMSTLQLDLFMGKRLGLKYIDRDGQEKNPIILHRGLTGSIERTLGILIEHFSGAFPVWLAPTQVVVIPVSSQANEYSREIAARLKERQIRVMADLAEARMQKKILFAQEQKVPYMIIIGAKEMAEKKISLRTREKKQFNLIELDKFISLVDKLNRDKSLNLWYNG